MTRNELETLAETDPMAFHKELEDWSNGTYWLDADNIEEITEKFLDAADGAIFFTDGSEVIFDADGIISIPSTEIKSIPLSWAMEARI